MISIGYFGRLTASFISTVIFNFVPFYIVFIVNQLIILLAFIILVCLTSDHNNDDQFKSNNLIYGFCRNVQCSAEFGLVTPVHPI